MPPTTTIRDLVTGVPKSMRLQIGALLTQIGEDKFRVAPEYMQAHDYDVILDAEGSPIHVPHDKDGNSSAEALVDLLNLCGQISRGGA